MLAHVLPHRRMGLLVTCFSAVLIALAALAPTGAEAAPNSLKITASDAVVTSSCEFTVTRVNPNNTGEPTVTARVTLKGAEIKPSFFAPRKVATLVVRCLVYGEPEDALVVDIVKFNNGSTLYKTKYVTVPFHSKYAVCVSAEYKLRDGTSNQAPIEECSPI